MRMNILPGSLWLAYTITSRPAIQSLLPTSLELSSCSLLQDDASSFPTPKLLFNVYTVDAGLTMQGVRTDVLTLARHRRDNTMHLVVLDCLTNTLQWNPIDGVKGPNAYCKQTTKRDNASSWIVRTRKNLIMVDAIPAKQRDIDWTFAVEANLACYFQDVDRAYTMSFDEDEIMQPVRMLSPTRHVINTVWHKHRSRKPSHVFCHEHPMHFDVHVSSFTRDEWRPTKN